MNILKQTRPDEDRDPEFPHAPGDWQQSDAERIASDEGLELGPDHWQSIRCLQEYFARHPDSSIKVRALKDALNESFHQQGGIGYLHRLFPGGPVAQGCRLAGLPVPAGAIDSSFGSVQ